MNRAHTGSRTKSLRAPQRLTIGEDGNSQALLRTSKPNITALEGT